MAPKRNITDKLRSYAAVRKLVMPQVEHRSHNGLNNQAENSHVPLRKLERTMQRFHSVGALHRFVPIFSSLRNLIVPARSSRSALGVQTHRLRTMAKWKAATAAASNLQSDPSLHLARVYLTTPVCLLPRPKRPLSTANAMSQKGPMNEPATREGARGGRRILTVDWWRIERRSTQAEHEGLLQQGA
jgi:DDE domain